MLAAGALLLAWSGARWKNRDFTRLSYALMALGAYRLLTADLHQDRTVALFLSLLAYGTALTILPRLSRRPV